MTAAHDEQYDAVNTDLFMNSVNIIDEELADFLASNLLDLTSSS